MTRTRLVAFLLVAVAAGGCGDDTSSCGAECSQPSGGAGAGGTPGQAGGSEGGGGAAQGGGHATGGSAASGGGGGVSIDGGGGSGSGGTLVDTCPVPGEDFVVATVPSPGSYTTRRRAGIQQHGDAAPGVLAVDYYGNGSFYDEELKRFTLGGDAWQTDYVADEQWGFSLAQAFATTSGDDPCVVYTDDYDGHVRLQCGSISDRVVAPDGATFLTIAAAGPLKHIVRARYGVGIEWITTDGGTPSVPEVLDPLYDISGLSLALDADGEPHVAYKARTGGGAGAVTMEVRYAVHSASGWQIQTVVTETAASFDSSKQSVAIAMGPTDRPRIAYHRESSRSLELVEWQGAGFGAPLVLDAPQPGYPDDDLGRYVALQVDCYDRPRVAYSRVVTTDPDPNTHLFHGVVEGGVLTQRTMVPLNGLFYGVDFDVAYLVDAQGHDHIAANAGYQLHYVTR